MILKQSHELPTPLPGTYREWFESILKYVVYGTTLIDRTSRTRCALTRDESDHSDDGKLGGGECEGTIGPRGVRINPIQHNRDQQTGRQYFLKPPGQRIGMRCNDP